MRHNNRSCGARSMACPERDHERAEAEAHRHLVEARRQAAAGEGADAGPEAEGRRGRELDVAEAPVREDARDARRHHGAERRAQRRLVVEVRRQGQERHDDRAAADSKQAREKARRGADAEQRHDLADRVVSCFGAVRRADGVEDLVAAGHDRRDREHEGAEGARERRRAQCGGGPRARGGRQRARRRDGRGRLTSTAPSAA